MTLQDIMDRLLAEGFEHCHFDHASGGTQIIVNNRGEIELMYGEAMIYDRLAPWTTNYGDHASHNNIDDLFADINATWTKEEFPCETSSAESSPSTAPLPVAEETATKGADPAPATEV